MFKDLTVASTASILLVPTAVKALVKSVRASAKDWKDCVGEEIRYRKNLVDMYFPNDAI